MNTIPAPSHVLLRRFLDVDNRLILSRGDFGDFLSAYRAHIDTWGEVKDGLSETLMRQGLAAGVIHLSNAPRDLSYGLTVHLSHPPTNVFITGDSPESAVTGRIYVEGVRDLGSSRLYMQSQRPRHEPSLSVLEVRGFDLLDIVEHYYLESEQRPIRLFELEDDTFIQVASLPGADPELFPGLTRESAAALFDGENVQLLEARPFFFQCGCNPQRMLAALARMFADDPEGIFQGDPKIEASCPRCGRRWWVTREEFDTAAAERSSGDEGPEGEGPEGGNAS